MARWDGDPFWVPFDCALRRIRMSGGIGGPPLPLSRNMEQGTGERRVARWDGDPFLGALRLCRPRIEPWSGVEAAMFVAALLQEPQDEREEHFVEK